MKERTLTGKLRPAYGRSSKRSRRTPGDGARKLGAVAGRGSLAALPWALALLGASAVLAAATVLAH